MDRRIKICTKLTMNHEWFKFGSMESNWLDKCFLNCFRSNRVVSKYVKMMMMMCDVMRNIHMFATTTTITTTNRICCCCYSQLFFQMKFHISLVPCSVCVFFLCFTIFGTQYILLELIPSREAKNMTDKSFRKLN